jgi:hypothetical protein
MFIDLFVEKDHVVHCTKILIQIWNYRPKSIRLCKNEPRFKFREIVGTEFKDNIPSSQQNKYLTGIGRIFVNWVP